jgi:hypothetical protein
MPILYLLFTIIFTLSTEPDHQLNQTTLGVVQFVPNMSATEPDQPPLRSRGLVVRLSSAVAFATAPTEPAGSVRGSVRASITTPKHHTMNRPDTPFRNVTKRLIHFERKRRIEEHKNKPMPTFANDQKKG